MPLSDHEQQVLDQMERALASEDPRFTSVFTGGRTAPRRTGPHSINKRSILGVIAAILVGIGGLIAGVMAQLPFLGILGFVLIVGAISVLVTTPRKSSTLANSAKPKKAKSRTSFMQGLEDRWDRRS